MRELMWFAIGSGSACVLCAYLLPDAYRWPSALTALLLAGIAWLLGRRLDRFAAMAVALLGFALGVVWFARFDQAYLQPAAALDGVTQGITIRVTDYSQETNYGTRVEGSITLKERSFRVLAYLDETDPLAPGDQIQGTFRCRVTTADGAENATYHQGKGIFMLLYQTGKTVRVNHAPDTWKDLPAKLRREIKQLLADCFPADTFPFAQALLLGDTGDLGYETDTDLKISGIRHVVAVSGLHVSILFALISIVTFRKRFLTVLLGLPALLLFAAVAGFTPSVTRACLMSGLLLAATLFQKSYDGPTALSFGRFGHFGWESAYHYQCRISAFCCQCGWDLPVLAKASAVACLLIRRHQPEGEEGLLCGMVLRFRFRDVGGDVLYHAVKRDVFRHGEPGRRGDEFAHPLGDQLCLLRFDRGLPAGVGLAERSDAVGRCHIDSHPLCSAVGKGNGGSALSGCVYPKRLH